ncbi:serine/threonine protein kinase [Stieleria sp. ICT_E10.1]|uniref:serine/threonine-protein kinase n=1 Tax=Stieleria sedimenti TaxID=2976331 RepID=UPI00217F98E6|nr:serine/threonine-protein kinase [Stieleria sedimenti]MCS7469490.1 serine/threonine protein kinase [Stieleria sedimenti]
MNSVDDDYWELCRIEDPGQRTRRLDQLCGNDLARRKRLADLLAHRERAQRLFGGLDSGNRDRVQTATDSDPLTQTTEGALDDTRDQRLVGEMAINQIGPYAIIRLVGQGGMGNVFKARDPALDRELALKVPRIEVMLSPDVKRRFFREARAAARLDHPHLVSILQVGADGPFPFIATQWCDHGDLATWMRANPGPRPPCDVALFMADVADAVQHCHDRQIVHLDLKPSNILLVARDGGSQSESSVAGLSPKVTDFGLARLMDVQLDRTTDSMFLGTPLYMSPEQAECKRTLIGPCSDVFALGVVLHELLIGVRPFEGETLTAVLDRIRQVNPDSQAQLKRLPRDLRTIITRCLQRDPADRYSSASALSDDLRNFAASRPIQARPVSLARRFWLWCNRSERITQAGAVTIAIQLAVLGNLYGHFLLLALGYELNFQMDNWEFFVEGLPLALCLHLPLLINGVRTIRHRRWSVAIGTTVSAVFVASIAMVLIRGESAFSMYLNNPFASYVAHLFILCLATIQFAVHLVAIPAARASALVYRL